MFRSDVVCCSVDVPWTPLGEVLLDLPPNAAAWLLVPLPAPPLWFPLLCVDLRWRSASCRLVVAVEMLPPAPTVAVCPAGIWMFCPALLNSVSVQVRQSLLAVVVFVFGS